MPVIEISCALLLTLQVGIALAITDDRYAFVRRFGLLAIAAWLAEDSCIRLYGFYGYSQDWSLFVDQMPLMIALIWPSVILSAWELTRHLLGAGHNRLPLAVGAMVFADAWLIEPIAVQSGLWSWFEPGLFDVPPIGVLGWAFFAALAVALFERVDRSGRSAWADVAILAVAPVGTHLLLLASWWGLLRWVNVTVPAWPAVAVLIAISAVVAWLAVRAKLHARIPGSAMVARIPAALFFFGLLAVHGRENYALAAWALAVAPPWLVITPWGALFARSPKVHQ